MKQMHIEELYEVSLLQNESIHRAMNRMSFTASSETRLVLLESLTEALEELEGRELNQELIKAHFILKLIEAYQEGEMAEGDETYYDYYDGSEYQPGRFSFSTVQQSVERIIERNQ